MARISLEKDGYLVMSDTSISKIADFFGMKQLQLYRYIQKNRQPEHQWMPYRGYIIHWRKVDLPFLDEAPREPVKHRVLDSHNKGAPLLAGHVTHRIH